MLTDRELVTDEQVIDKLYELKTLLVLCGQDIEHYQLLVGGVNRFLRPHPSPATAHETESAALFLRRLLNSGRAHAK